MSNAYDTQVGGQVFNRSTHLRSLLQGQRQIIVELCFYAEGWMVVEVMRTRIKRPLLERSPGLDCPTRSAFTLGFIFIPDNKIYSSLCVYQRYRVVPLERLGLYSETRHADD